MDTRQTNLLLPVRLVERIDALAAAEHRTRSKQVLVMLESLLKADPEYLAMTHTANASTVAPKC